MRLSKQKTIIIGIILLILTKINYYDTGIYFFVTFAVVILVKIISDFAAGDV